MFDFVTSILGLLAQLGLFGPLLLLTVGFLLGCWFYRWMLKRNPKKLEVWAAEAKALKILTTMKLKGKIDQ